jgi:signal peptidase II
MKSLPSLLLKLTLPLYVLDQVTKWLIVLNFDEPVPGATASYEIYPVIDGFFNIVRVHNQGAAFGLGNGTAWAPFVFFVIAVVALGALGIFWKRGAFNSLLLRLSAGLLAAGILGNLTDRVFQGFVLSNYEGESFLTRLARGYVVDFLDFILPWYGHWPSFNVADSCICVAAVFLVLSTFRSETESKDKKEPAEANAS